MANKIWPLIPANIKNSPTLESFKAAINKRLPLYALENLRPANRIDLSKKLVKTYKNVYLIIYLPTVFPIISVRAFTKYFQKLHGRLLEGALN